MPTTRLMVLTSSILFTGMLTGVAVSQQTPPTEGRGLKAAEPISVDLGPELTGRKLRMRVITIEPGGVVPLHSHKDNPTIAHYYGGKLTEFSADGKMVQERGGGATFADGREINHWYENRSGSAVTVAVADVIK